MPLLTSQVQRDLPDCFLHLLLGHLQEPKRPPDLLRATLHLFLMHLTIFFFLHARVALDEDKTRALCASNVNNSQRSPWPFWPPPVPPE